MRQKFHVAGILMFLSSGVPIILFCIGVVIAWAAGCMGQGNFCTLFQTNLGVLSANLIAALWLLVITIPVGLVGLVILLVTIPRNQTPPKA